MGAGAPLPGSALVGTLAPALRRGDPTDARAAASEIEMEQIGRGERSRTSITDLSVRSRRLRCAVIGADRSLIRVG
jgi:hypothetical protein